jgi:diguanylate cyclase (GGDEF)-like protein
VVTQHGEKYTFIWTYFFAPFAMITLSAKRGLLVTSLFLAILFLLTCTGIGSWQNGQWDLPSYTRFTLSHFVMLYVLYAILNGYEKANRKIEYMHLNEKSQLKLLEKLSVTDPLTGLYNRRFLNEIFPKQLYSAHRGRQYLAFFLLDIDHFKIYNDTYGHQQGDDALIKVAEILKQGVSDNEHYAFRIGGDEFAGLVLADNEQEVASYLRKIQQQIESLQIENQHSPVRPWLTISIGAYILEEPDCDFHEVFRKTDMALYKAKREGRNRIVLQN